ncbi:MAG: RNA polymerase factor sigma-54 [Oscillospiraceae bacterium]
MELELEIKQSLSLSPQLIQSMEMLQMSAQELAEYISETLQENPVLETDERSDSSEEFTLISRQLDWLEDSDPQNYWYHQQDARDMDPLTNVAEESPEEESLYYHLLFQLDTSKLPPAVAKAAVYIIGSLDDNGYLVESVPTIARELGYTEKEVSHALREVQALDPPGIAACSLSECLCIQLRRMGETGLPYQIAAEFLDEVGKNHYNYIARKLKVSEREVRLACRVIRSLDPRPGAAFSPPEKPEYIIPDLTVMDYPDHMEPVLNSSFIPSLRISSYYRKLMRETDDPKVKEYLSGKLEEARWVVRSIEKRQSTLLACARIILEKQADFFRKGPGHLRPLSLADIADALGVHPSTVSRAIRGKYLQCSHGVYPLSSFFSRALGEDSMEGASPDEAKALIRELIQEENKKKPLSDQKICELMEAKGISLSRRTVAKYRSELGIPSASGRKEIN